MSTSAFLCVCVYLHVCMCINLYFQVLHFYIKKIIIKNACALSYNVCMHVCMNACVCACIFICICVRVCVCMYARMYLCTCVCMFVCVYTFVHASMYVVWKEWMDRLIEGGIH